MTKDEHIKQLEQDKCELLGIIQGKDKAIKDLKDDNKVMSDNYSHMEQKFYDNLTQAKGLLRELYSIIKVKCSPFIREEHKNILTETLEFLQEE